MPNTHCDREGKMMEGTMQNSTLKKGDKIREALRPDMLDSHNHAPRTMYEGDR